MIHCSEQVAPGHPDRVAGLLADAVVQQCLEVDKDSHCGIEVLINGTSVTFAGEIKSKHTPDLEKAVQRVFRVLGYNKIETGIDLNNFEIVNKLVAQSPDIAQGVELEDKIGAGDQGIMFGYAHKNPEYNYHGPVKHMVNRLQVRLTEFAKSRSSNYFPDSKCQITIDNDQIINVTISQSHSDEIGTEEVRETILKEVLEPFYEEFSEFDHENTVIHINATGRFVHCGPAADTGITGRKLVCDAYGRYAPVGGGADVGKDPTKVDRSAAYMARRVAVSIMDIMNRQNPDMFIESILIELGYCIGVPDPVALNVTWAFNDGRVVEDFSLAEQLRESHIFNVANIIDNLKLHEVDLVESNLYGWATDPNSVWNKPIPGLTLDF